MRTHDVQLRAAAVDKPCRRLSGCGMLLQPFVSNEATTRPSFFAQRYNAERQDQCHDRHKAQDSTQ